MRRFAPIVALTLVVSTTFFAGSALADEGDPVAPSSPPAEVPLPQQLPPPPPRSASKEPSTLRRPKTLHEFKVARNELEKRLDGASEEERFRIRKDLRLLEHCFEQDTEMTSRFGVVTGVVMLSAGGGAAVFTGIGFAFANLFNFRGGSTPPAALYGAAIGSGLAVAGIGIGLIVYGSPRVMKVDSRTSATSLFSPSARLLVGPGTMGFEGTF